MAPKDVNLSNKFIVTSKIFVSLLPDSHTFIPEKLLSITETDVPSNVFLLDTPEDDNSWFKYLKVAKTGELFEEACSIYPKYWKVYYRHALYYAYNKDSTKAFQVFNHALKELNDYDLYMKYLIFLYHTGSIHEYIGSLVDSVEKVGMDYRSDCLWKEWAMILVKIYNCNLLAMGMTSGLLPDLFSVDPNVLKTPLVPNETEQLVYRSQNALDESNRTYLEMYGEVNSIRNLFQKWMKTPTNNMRALWDAYSTFENTVDSTGTLSAKLLGDMKGVINLSMRSYERLTEMYSKVYPIKPASYESTMSSPENVEGAINNWMEIIKFEESNPTETTNEEVGERVLFHFERALCPLVFSREMWYKYFQFLLFVDKKDEAITKMTMALKKYLKEDDKMRFVLALYLEEVGEFEKAEEEFTNLVSTGLKTSELDKDSKGEMKLRKLLECKDYLSFEKSELDRLVNYLNYVRREKGTEEWREEVHLILSKSELNSWDLYWYAATTELRSFKDHDRAIKILKQAQNKMPFSLQHTLLFFNTMLNVGKHIDVRILLSELVVGSMDRASKLTEKDREELWTFWMNMEYLYGNQETFDNVKNIYVSSVISERLGLDTFTERSTQKSKPTIFALYSDVETAFGKSAATSKRKAAQDFSSIVESRRKLFCSGIEFDQLDKIFKFNLYQEDKKEELKEKKEESGQMQGRPQLQVQAQVPVVELPKEVKTVKQEEGEAKTVKEEVKQSQGKQKEDNQEKQPKKESKRSKSKKGTKGQTSEKNEQETEQPQLQQQSQQQQQQHQPLKDNQNKNKNDPKNKNQSDRHNQSQNENYVRDGAKRLPGDEFATTVKYGTQISRPNVSRLSEIEPKMTTSLESLVQLHGSKRPILPPKFRPLDSTGTPCKALFDFIRILPSSKDNKFSNLYVNTESVDYLIRTVENMDLEKMEIDQYEPLPTNLSAQLKQTDETLNEKSFEFNQGLENILRFLQDNALFDDRPAKRQKIAI